MPRLTKKFSQRLVILCLVMIACIAVIASVLLYNAYAFKGISYYIDFGFDTANGDYLTRKRWTNGTVEWVRRSQSEYAGVYKKYGLSHDKPLISYCTSDSYNANHFIRFQKRKNWRPWRWKWFVFEDIPVDCSCGSIPIMEFLEYARSHDLPTETVKSTYDGCVECFDNFQNLQNYLMQQMDELKSVHLMHQYHQLVSTGSEGLYKKLDHNRFKRIFKTHREQFPQELPDAFMELLANHGYKELLENEYMSNPKRNVALFLALSYTYMSEQDRKQFHVLPLFYNLNHSGKLSSFIQQVYPETISFPPRPTLLDMNDSNWASDIKVKDLYPYTDLPERQKLLNISANIETYRKYWLEEVRKQASK